LRHRKKTNLDLNSFNLFLSTKDRAANHRREDGGREVGTSETALHELEISRGRIEELARGTVGDNFFFFKRSVFAECESEDDESTYAGTVIANNNLIRVHFERFGAQFTEPFGRFASVEK
jgi:hypothetical protein